MRQLVKPSTSHLAHAELVAVPGRSGDRIHCWLGSLWITQDNDPCDHVVDAGRSFVLTRSGTTIVYAFEESVITMHRRSSDDRPGVTRRLLDPVERWARSQGERVWQLLVSIANTRWEHSYQRRAVEQRLSEIDAHTLRAIGVDLGDSPEVVTALAARVDPSRVREALLARREFASF